MKAGFNAKEDMEGVRDCLQISEEEFSNNARIKGILRRKRGYGDKTSLRFAV